MAKIVKYDVTQEDLKRLFTYDTLTGHFIRNITVSHSAKKGDIAGSPCIEGGYIHISIKKRQYYAHRLAWIYMHGTLPPIYIDHIDRNKGNNAWKNLREADEVQSCCNRVETSSSAYRGVSKLTKNSKRWRAKIKYNGSHIHIGTFDTALEAAKAYNIKATELHGEFAVLNTLECF
jgi:hypothetical protein